MKKKGYKMRKDLVLFACFLFLIFLAPMAFAITYGDVNSDNTINIVDAMLIAQYSAGIQPTNFLIAAADVSGDGQITVVDALLVARYSAGMITVFPRETVLPTPTPTPVNTCVPCNLLISGKVTNSNGLPLSDAEIYFARSAVPNTKTDTEGNFRLTTLSYTGTTCSYDNTSLTVKASGFYDSSKSLTLNGCGDYKINTLTLNPLPPPTPTPTPILSPTPSVTYFSCSRSTTYSGTVTDSITGLPIAGAAIYEGSLMTVTDASGHYSYNSSCNPGGNGCPDYADTYFIIRAYGYQGTWSFTSANCGSGDRGGNHKLTPLAVPLTAPK